jgi:hypothetical protein
MKSNDNKDQMQKPVYLSTTPKKNWGKKENWEEHNYVDNITEVKRIKSTLHTIWIVNMNIL